jgi:hypothetical protein
MAWSIKGFEILQRKDPTGKTWVALGGACELLNDINYYGWVFTVEDAVESTLAQCRTKLLGSGTKRSKDGQGEGSRKRRNVGFPIDSPVNSEEVVSRFVAIVLMEMQGTL